MKINVSYLLLIAVAIVLMLPVTNVSATGTSSTGPNCSRLDQTHALHFITYEGVSFSDVRLRLRNNSDCPIFVETDVHEPFTLRGDTWVVPHYLVPGGTRQALKPAYDWGHVVSAIEIKGGDSILFRVPVAYFGRCWGMAVPFSYDSENFVNTNASGVQHLIYFLTRDLPPEVRRRK
jgi:hypothetical protein